MVGNSDPCNVCVGVRSLCHPGRAELGVGLCDPLPFLSGSERVCFDERLKNRSAQIRFGSCYGDQSFR